MTRKNLKKKIIVTLITLSFFSILSAYSLTATTVNTITVNTDAPHYYPGENVRITGVLKEDGTGVPNGDVCVSIRNPSGEEVFSICTMTGSTGGFSLDYTATTPYGTYTIKAESDGYNVVTYDTFEVVTKEVTANTNGPYYGAVNQPIQFTGSVQGGKSPYTWLWVFGDGTNTSNEKNPIYSFSNTGNYSISLNVRDLGGFQDTDYSYVVITNELIADAHGPYEAPPNISIQFSGDAFGGYPPYTYLWDFGDGNTSTLQNPTHSYQTFGEYELILTVMDAKDLTASNTTTVIISTNIAPEKPEITGSIEGKAGEEYNYTCNAIDANGNDVYYKWDWGDGQITDWIGPYQSATPITFSHAWEEKGDYEIRVKAKDIYDLESDWSDPLTVTMPKSKENNMFFDIFSLLWEWIQQYHSFVLFPSLF